MEISARIFAVSGNRDLLAQAGEILKKQSFQTWLGMETIEPCAVLPLTRTMYGFTLGAEPTDGPEGWKDCLGKCAQILGKDGIVMVEFRSPDHPDEELDYAYTTSGGRAGSGHGMSVISYYRAPGYRDLDLALKEMISGRTAWDRERLCRRMEKKEAVRREKGDFEITSDGVLKRYRGHDTDVVIPDGVREIGESAFVDLKGVERMIMECEDYEAPEMETLVIPESVEKIGYYAFAYCRNLKKVEMTDRVRDIGERAFEGCESLTSIRLPAGLTRIGDSTFFLCESLKSITIPEGVIRIEQNAFRGCWSLKKAVLPESLKSIGDNAFDGTKVQQARIPKGVTEIGENAFPD